MLSNQWEFHLKYLEMRKKCMPMLTFKNIPVNSGLFFAVYKEELYYLQYRIISYS